MRAICAINAVNFEPVKRAAVADTIDALYLPLVIGEAANITARSVLRRAQEDHAALQGLVYACKDGAQGRPSTAA